MVLVHETVFRYPDATEKIKNNVYFCPLTSITSNKQDNWQLNHYLRIGDLARFFFLMFEISQFPDIRDGSKMTKQQIAQLYKLVSFVFVVKPRVF